MLLFQQLCLFQPPALNAAGFGGGACLSFPASWRQLVTSVELIWFISVGLLLFSHLSLVSIIAAEFLIVLFTVSFF